MQLLGIELVSSPKVISRYKIEMNKDVLLLFL